VSSKGWVVQIVCFDSCYGFFDAAGIVGDSEIVADRPDKDIELCFTGIDTDINLLL